VACLRQPYAATVSFCWRDGAPARCRRPRPQSLSSSPLPDPDGDAGAVAEAPIERVSRRPKRWQGPYEYHEELTLRVESLTNLGLGVCRHTGGWVVMVPYVIPGELVRWNGCCLPGYKRGGVRSGRG
jgi:predicted RNA-binding protein with TRAM domain